MPDLSKICWSDFSSHDLDLGNDVLDYDEYYDSSLSDQEASWFTVDGDQATYLIIYIFRFYFQ